MASSTSSPGWLPCSVLFASFREIRSFCSSQIMRSGNRIGTPEKNSDNCKVNGKILLPVREPRLRSAGDRERIGSAPIFEKQENQLSAGLLKRQDLLLSHPVISNSLTLRVLLADSAGRIPSQSTKVRKRFVSRVTHNIAKLYTSTIRL